MTFESGLEGRSQVLGQAVGRVSGTFEEGLWRVRTAQGAEIGVCLAWWGRRGQKCPLGGRAGGLNSQATSCVHFDVRGTLSYLSSEFSSALEYLKLLNSSVDSVGVMAPPSSSSSVLKSALGKCLAGWSLWP